VTADAVAYALPASGTWKALAELPETSRDGEVIQLPPYGVSWFTAI
jgi:hypothetical protein